MGVPGPESEELIEGIQLTREGRVLSRVTDEDLLFSLGLSSGGGVAASTSMWDWALGFPWSVFARDVSSDPA